MYKEFIKNLEKDLRRETNESYIFEEINQEYETKMIQIFNKAIQDEIQAAVSYKILAENIDNFHIKKEIQEHADEEYKHYSELIEYAANHNILNKLTYTPRVESLPTDEAQIIDYIQELETEAYKLYKESADIANQEGDTETRLFFEELMRDEMKHFDDLSRKIKRNLNDF